MEIHEIFSENDDSNTETITNQCVINCHVDDDTAKGV